LDDSTIYDWEYPGPAKRVSFQLSTFTQLLQPAVDKQIPLHLVPVDPNFPVLDSLIHRPGHVLSHIQVTTRIDHPVAIVGLKQIQGSLKGALASEKPTWG
jgi:hypothetical protein